jgi:hypothetical protein
VAANLVGDTEPALQRECSVFTRYLTNREPDDYLLGKYVAMQACAARPDACDRIDAALLRVARLGVTATRIADAYARIFRPRTVLRRKLILALALAENSRAFHRSLTSGAVGSRAANGLRAAGAVAAFALALLTGVLIFTPLRFLPGSAERGGAG